MYRFRIVTLLLLLLTSCQKENTSPQWDVEILGPLAHATLGMNQLFGDSSIESMSDGALVLNFDTTFSQFTLDSIYEIEDTTIYTIEKFPPVSTHLPANFPFVTNNNDVKLKANGVELRQAIIHSGKIRLEIKNILNSKIIFTYTIPKATKNGIPFEVVASVDSADNSDPKYFFGEYDFSGYSIDLTGSTGNLVNTLSYNVEALSDPNGVGVDVNGGDTTINLQTTLIDIQPYFVRGYLGQTQTTDAGENIFEFGELIKGGTIELDSIRFKMNIENYIGADEQLLVSSFRSINSRTGSTLDLVAPSFINQYLNINRATINPSLADSLIPSHYNILLDHTNSNIRELIENLPEKFGYDINLNLNPMGNISGGNDFIYRDRLVNTRLQINMPLRFAMDQLILADTVDFSIAGSSFFENVGPATLTLLADNEFPFDLYLQIFLLDSTNTVVDSMFVPDLIASAPYDINYRSTGIQRTEIKIPIDANRKNRILSVKRIGIRMKFDTPDYPQLIQMYSNYKVSLKIIADGIYSIR